MVIRSRRFKNVMARQNSAITPVKAQVWYFNQAVPLPEATARKIYSVKKMLPAIASKNSAMAAM